MSKVTARCPAGPFLPVPPARCPPALDTPAPLWLSRDTLQKLCGDPERPATRLRPPDLSPRPSHCVAAPTAVAVTVTVQRREDSGTGRGAGRHGADTRPHLTPRQHTCPVSAERPPSSGPCLIRREGRASHAPRRPARPPARRASPGGCGLADGPHGPPPTPTHTRIARLWVPRGRHHRCSNSQNQDFLHKGKRRFWNASAPSHGRGSFSPWPGQAQRVGSRPPGSCGSAPSHPRIGDLPVPSCLFPT